MLMTPEKKQWAAYVGPFVVFMVFLALDQGLAWVAPADGPWWLREAKYWVYPLQTIVCGGVLVYFWREYQFAPLRPWLWGVLAGIAALALWVSPQAVFGAEARVEGFNPEALGSEGAAYWLTVVGRMARLVIVVPLVEEIFWRGFLMRYLIREEFTKVAFGTYGALSFFGTAALFMLAHGTADWPAAVATGLIYNAVAVRTKSLFACVVAHAVTNAGLGVYILATRQWGFW